MDTNSSFIHSVNVKGKTDHDVTIEVNMCNGNSYTYKAPKKTASSFLQVVLKNNEGTDVSVGKAFHEFLDGATLL